MSTTPQTPNPAVSPAPVTINTPAADIAAANSASQQTPTPGQPRDDAGRFVATPPPAAPPQATPAAPQVVQTPAGEYTMTPLGNGAFEVKYATGEVFKGTAEQIIAEQAKGHVNTKRWAQEQVRNAQQIAAPPPPTPQPAAPQVNPEEAAAMEYIANMTAKYMGFESAEAMRQTFGGIQQSSEQFSAKALAADFQAATPDFNPTQENVAALTKFIDDAGLPYNVTTLQMAHAMCLRTGVYQAAVPQAPVTPTVQTPPPMLPPSSAVNNPAASADLSVNVNMPAEEIKRRWELAKAQVAAGGQ